MNSWANVGDSVYVLNDENEIIPCKVVKEIGTGAKTQLFFEPIKDEDKEKISENKLKCFIDNAGYSGGFVFRMKYNAVNYLNNVINKNAH